MNGSQRNASARTPARGTLKLRNRILGNLGNTGKGLMRATLLLATLGFAATVVASPPAAPKSGDSSATASVRHHPWFEIGRASWYGRRFQGHKTASGEPFDMNELTCAHRTLPLGSWVRVTNLRNRKSVFLRVNDRGPVPLERIVDLSYAAAQRLGITGTAKVRIDKVNPDDPEVAQEVVASLPPVNEMAALR